MVVIPNHNCKSGLQIPCLRFKTIPNIVAVTNDATNKKTNNKGGVLNNSNK